MIERFVRRVNLFTDYFNMKHYVYDLPINKLEDWIKKHEVPKKQIDLIIMLRDYVDERIMKKIIRKFVKKLSKAFLITSIKLRMIIREIQHAYQIIKESERLRQIIGITNIRELLAVIAFLLVITVNTLILLPKDSRNIQQTFVKLYQEQLTVKII